MICTLALLETQFQSVRVVLDALLLKCYTDLPSPVIQAHFINTSELDGLFQIDFFFFC